MILNNRDWYIFIRDDNYMVGKLPYALKSGKDIEILGYAATKLEAYQLLEALVGYRPLKPHKQGVPITCLDTGETFPSAAAACERYGISPAFMSGHLTGRLGCNTCKGMRFKYTTSDIGTIEG